MNKLEQLLNELCPDGVEFKWISKLADITTGKLNANAMVEWGKYPFFTCAEKPFLIDDYAFDTEAILISWNGSQVGHINYYKGKFNAYQRTYILSNFSNEIEVGFILFCLKNSLKEYILKNVKEGSVPYITLPMLQTFQIPIPPIEIQKEIVKILDTFTMLEAELEAELEARKKQYEYYRDDLLSFEDDEVEWKSLDDVCLSINAGWDLPEKYLKGQKEPTEEFPYPIYSNWTDSSALYGYTDSYKVDNEAVTISARGTIGYHTIRNPKFTPIVRLITCIPNNEIITTKFLNYILDKTEIWHSGWSIPQLTTPNVKKLKIPVPFKNWKPDLKKQQEIVAILDKFDALVNDISIWLPAELTSRRQQYEYYRNKLLTFKVLEK